MKFWKSFVQKIDTERAFLLWVLSLQKVLAEKVTELEKSADDADKQKFGYLFTLAGIAMMTDKCVTIFQE